MTSDINNALIELVASKLSETFAQIVTTLPCEIGLPALGRAVGSLEASVELFYAKINKSEGIEDFERAKLAGRMACAERWDKNKALVDAICASVKK